MRTAFEADLGFVRDNFPKPDKKANKYDRGRLLILAGSPGMAGAAKLAATAAGRSGCGLVQLMSDERLFDTLSAALTTQLTGFYQTDWEWIGDAGVITPEGMDRILAEAERADAIVVGCGWGRGKDRFELILKLAATGKPLLLDADAINSCVGNIDKLTKCGGNLLLTPHIGEFARISGLSAAQITADREKAAADFAARYGVTLVLKDYVTCIATKDRLAINKTGCAAMAKGGSGDVLAGVIGALLAQSVKPFEAATVGAWCCGKAGEAAAEQLGDAYADATDTIAALSGVFKALEN